MASITKFMTPKKNFIEEIYGDRYTIKICINNCLYKTNATLIKTYHLTNCE